jgi:hypothetical protein
MGIGALERLFLFLQGPRSGVLNIRPCAKKKYVQNSSFLTVRVDTIFQV